MDTSKELTGGKCGECSLCCKKLLIDVPELKKSANTWCQHCRPGKGGCSIYETRPDICRGFACVWLADPGIGQEWKPSRSKIVACLEKEKDKLFYNFVVDLSVANRWREEPYYSTIKQIAFNGLNSIGGQYFQTHIKIGRRTIIVLPNNEVDVTDIPHAVIRTRDSVWEVMKFNSWDEGRQFVDRLNKATEAFAAMPRSVQEQLLAEAMTRR